MVSTALITGISGQTGSLLAQKLLEDGYRVVGGSRDVSATDWWRLDRLGVRDRIELVSLASTDFPSVFSVLGKYAPNEIYNLSGQSSVGLSFSQPFEAFESIATGTLNLLEAIRVLDLPTRFFNAASTDCFGNQPGVKLNEKSAMRPVSPYGVAKMASYWTTVNYRHSFGIHACNGILTNHESGLRGKAFVTQKIVKALIEKKKNPTIQVKLGDTGITRDWLWAPDVVDAIRLIITANKAGDYVVGSGESNSLHNFVMKVADALSLSPENLYTLDADFLRPNEIPSVELDTSLVRNDLGWSHTLDFDALVLRLLHEIGREHH